MNFALTHAFIVHVRGHIFWLVTDRDGEPKICSSSCGPVVLGALATCPSAFRKVLQHAVSLLSEKIRSETSLAPYCNRGSMMDTTVQETAFITHLATPTVSSRVLRKSLTTLQTTATKLLKFEGCKQLSLVKVNTIVNNNLPHLSLFYPISSFYLVSNPNC